MEQNGVQSTSKSIHANSSPTPGVEEIESITMTKVKAFLDFTLVPILIMTIMPNFVLILKYTVLECDGSYVEMLSQLIDDPAGFLENVWTLPDTVSSTAIYFLCGFSIFSAALQILVPGKTVYGPLTPKGNTPEYKENGFRCYIITMTSFVLLHIYLKSIGSSSTIIYDNYGEILIYSNVFAFIFCIFLYLKGLFAPSSSDAGSSGNPIFDYYWGTELYPRIFGIDIKVFTNCRFGLSLWTLYVIIHAIKSYEMNGFVDSIMISAFLQVVYLTKFYWWEVGYYSTMDIMIDRAGFYICWGCLVFVQSYYTSVTFYLVTHPVHLGVLKSCAILTFGLIAIAINYHADWQKEIVRKTDGNCEIWGKKPKIIHAKYMLDNGEIRNSILLVSGWWGVARHFNYVAELSLALAWSLPAMFAHLYPYSYFIFLCILLTHRSFRDEERCRNKYGRYWDDYCSEVPYKMIPGVF